jgi:hypothetical protein
LELPGYSPLDKDRRPGARRVQHRRVRPGGSPDPADPDARARLAGLLVTGPVSGRSGVDRLKAPAKAATLGKFKAKLAYVSPLCLAGARVREMFQIGIVQGSVTVIIGALSYAGQLNIAVVGDPEAVSDLAVFAAGLAGTLEQLGVDVT